MHVVHVLTVTGVVLAVTSGAIALGTSNPANLLSETLTPLSAARMLSETFTSAAKRVANTSEAFACSGFEVSCCRIR